MTTESLTKTIFVSKEHKAQLDERLLKLGPEYLLRLFDADDINFRKFLDGDMLEIAMTPELLDGLVLAYMRHRGLDMNDTPADATSE